MKLSRDRFSSSLVRTASFVLAFAANAAIAEATVLTPIDDTHIDLDGTGPYGSGTELVAKMKRNTSTNASYNAVAAVVRFKVNSTDIANDAALYLDVSTYDEAVTSDFRLWGLNDSAGLPQLMEEEIFKWGHFAGIINDTDIGVNTSASGVFDGNPGTSAKDPLATITLTQADLGKTVKFSSAAIKDFINADNDGVVTFVVTRVLRSNSFDTAFASKEHPTLNPPRLFVDAQNTVHASRDTYARYGDTSSHGAETEILVKNNGAAHPNTRRGVVRFDLPAGTDVENATLSFDVSMYYQDVGTKPQSLNFIVYGMRDGTIGEAFPESAGDNYFFQELDGSPDGVRNTAVEALGKFNVKSTDVGKTVSFTSDALVDFMNADENGKISLIIARAEYTPYLNFSFASRENTTLEGPRLAYTQAIDAVASPTLKFVYKDVTGDGENELLLVVEMPGGDGYVMYDPFSIAEAIRVAGYGFGNGTDFWDTLSPTQQAALLATVSDLVPNVGSTVEASELDAARAGLPEGRTYSVLSYEGDYESSSSGWGSTLSTSVFSSSSQNALGYSSVEVGSGQAGAMFTDSGVAFGAESNLLVLTTGVGDPSGTTASANLSMGVGLYGELKYGQDGQYGFSVPLVVVPVGVSVYVKGSDAVNAWNTVSGFVIDEGRPLYGVSKNVYEWGIDWSHDVRVVSVNTVADSALSVTHHGQVAVVWTRDGAREATVWMNGTASAVGQQLTTSVFVINSALSSTAGNAAAQLTSFSSMAGSTVVSVYDSTSGWVSGGVATLGGLMGTIGGGAVEVVNDVVDPVRCNALWCF